MAIIEVKNLAKQYPLPDNKSKSFFAVDGISLAIEAGEIFGILGPNGAGKTTTLEMRKVLSTSMVARPLSMELMSAKSLTR